MSLSAMTKGLETIKYQDDEFADKLILSIGKVKETMEFYKIKGKDVYKNNLTLKHIEEMDKLISKRFGPDGGLSVKLVYGGKNVMAYVKMPPVLTTTLDDDFDKTFKSLQKKQVDATDKDNRIMSKRMWSDISKTQEALIKHNKKNKIVINVEDATISGMSKTIVNHIAIDFDETLAVNGITTKAMTDKEIGAIIAHEIGHMFTWLEYGYRQIKNTIILVDSIRNIKSPGEFRKILNKTGDALGTDMNQIKDKHKVTEVIKRLSEQVNIDNAHRLKDSEALADQFATRFGFGPALTSALVKITQEQNSLVDAVNTYFLIRVVIVSLFLTIIGGVGLGIYMMSVYISTKVLMELLLSVAIGSVFSEKTGSHSYDTLSDRFLRIKQDIIRQMSVVENIKGGPEKINQLLSQLDMVRNNLTFAYGEDKIGRAIGDKLFNGDKLNYSLMEKNLEALEANPVMAMKHKLKQHMNKG